MMPSRIQASSASDLESRLVVSPERPDVALARLLAERGFVSAVVLHGRTTGELGSKEAIRLSGREDVAEAQLLGVRVAERGAGVVVAAGGGRVLDIGKIAAVTVGLPFVAIPSQLSHDGLCSPVAVLPEGDRTISLGAMVPDAVLVSLPLVATAPLGRLAAGIGDVLGNHTALLDWELDASHRSGQTIVAARELSLASVEAVEAICAERTLEDLGRPEVLGALARALCLSGLAMVRAGTSRPCSGSEHEVSHAIDWLYGHLAPHGAQVALGTLCAGLLHGIDVRPLVQAMTRFGLPTLPSSLGLSRAQMVDVLVRAPETRPDRWTIIEEVGVDAMIAGTILDQLEGLNRGS